MKKLITKLLSLGEGIPTHLIDQSQTRNINLILFALLYTTLGGALRKWGFGSSFISNIILFGQILLPFALFLSFKRTKLNYQTLLVLTIYALLLFAQAVNPMNHTVFHGIFGIFLHLGIWLILFQYLDNPEQFPLERLVPLFIILLTFELVLGFTQYNLPKEHFLNRYANINDKSISEQGSGIRVTGTFSYLSGYTAFIFGWNLVSWAIFLFRFPSWLGYSSLMAGFICALMSGSRGATALTIALGIIALVSNLKGNRLIGRIIGIFLAGIVGLTIGLQTKFVQTAISNFLTRVEGNYNTGESSDRTVGVFEEIFDFKGDYPVFGIGLGSTYQGSNQIWGESVYLKRYGGYEEEPERIILEGGFILFFIKFILLWIFYSRSKIPAVFSIPLVILMFISVPIVFNVFNAFYFYFGILLVDRAYRLQKGLS